VLSKVKVLHRILHFTAGAVSGFSVLVNPTLSAVSALLFVTYELVEMVRRMDFAYPELLDFSLGYFASCVLLLLKLFS